jgi:hypothetical protein
MDQAFQFPYLFLLRRNAGRKDPADRSQNRKGHERRAAPPIIDRAEK